MIQLEYSIADRATISIDEVGILINNRLFLH